mgnify:FL=1
MVNKKAALELSIGTIVIIVLAMSMLILGLVLVRNIFTGATYNVDQLNKNVEAEINKLFNERGDKIVMYLGGNQAEIEQGKSYGVAFGIKNTVEGEAQAGSFSYKVEASDVQRGCQLTLQQANQYLILGSTGTFALSPGQIRYNLVKVQPSSSAPLCEIRYDISVLKDSQPYDSTFFIVKIE